MLDIPKSHFLPLPGKSNVNTPLPKISIVMPIFNRVRLLDLTLKSITAQTFSDWELIIVDDGSTDGSGELINSFAQTVSQKVFYLRQKNQGAAIARNNGVKVAGCEFVAFLDSDDRWCAEHLETLYKILVTNVDIDWICSDMQTMSVIENRITIKSKFFGETKYRLLKDKSKKIGDDLIVLSEKDLIKNLIRYGIFGQISCSLLRKKVFSKVDFSTFRIGEDRYLAIMAALNGFRLAILERVTVTFVVHDQHTSIAKNSSIESIKKSYDELLRMYRRLITEKSMPQLCRIYLRKVCGNIYFWEYAYSGLWMKNQYKNSISIQRKALIVWPFSLSCGKTFLICCIKYLAVFNR